MPILYIVGFKGRKMDKFISDRENATIIAFDNPVSDRFSPNNRAGDMVFSHPLSLTMKYKFEEFVVEFIYLKVFGRLLLS